MSNKRKAGTCAAAGGQPDPDATANPPQPSVARNEAPPARETPGSASSEPDPRYCSMHKFLHQWLTRWLRLGVTIDALVLAFTLELVWASKDGAAAVVLDDSFLTVRLTGENFVRTALKRLVAAHLVRVLPAPRKKSTRYNHPIALVKLPWSGGGAEHGEGLNDGTV